MPAKCREVPERCCMHFPQVDFLSSQIRQDHVSPKAPQTAGGTIPRPRADIGGAGGARKPSVNEFPEIPPACRISPRPMLRQAFVGVVPAFGTLWKGATAAISDFSDPSKDVAHRLMKALVREEQRGTGSVLCKKSPYHTRICNLGGAAQSPSQPSTIAFRPSDCKIVPVLLRAAALSPALSNRPTQRESWFAHAVRTQEASVHAC